MSTDRLRGRCACSWDDCRELQTIFTARVNNGEVDVRGGTVRELDLTGDSEQKKSWRQAVLSNIGASKVDDLSKVFLSLGITGRSNS